ncbi:ABC transporter ATP-binding protein [Halobaculum halobium]|uniref:ABC transporter ATP-binding protein n=1 Tax=Halobaculum halobium TaxID=3032281 RepID=A0ABD5TBJ3_9EURY|nr:ABC transporter ATP-binding protein [Halobaculum sp. SYNS20]
MTDSVVSLSDVHMSFGDVTIVDDCSVSIESGELVALVGPNGSGKTTFLELLTSIRQPNSGTVSRPTPQSRRLSEGTEDRRDVAYLPQSPSFRPGFTAAETLQFYASLAGTSVDPEAALGRVGLASATDRRVGALSGGMTRLLGIAQALVGDPPLVVLDEPTSGLDPEMADHIFATARDVVDEDRALVVASHDLAGVERVADRVMVLADGEITLDGSPAELRSEMGAETLRDVFSGLATSRDHDRVVPPAKAATTDGSPPTDTAESEVSKR